MNAQGEDVVAGIRTPEPLERMEAILPDAYAQLVETMGRLERHYRDMQDIEFTVEDGALFLLQTRSAKRTAAAALKAAVSMSEEGLISQEEAVARIDPGSSTSSCIRGSTRTRTTTSSRRGSTRRRGPRPGRSCSTRTRPPSRGSTRR